jgi:hypothetical protein
MIVTMKVEKTSQATTMVMIKTVMAYSFNQLSSSEPFNPGAGFSPGALLSNWVVVSLGGPAIMQSENWLDP